ncbi:AMP-binding protein [uncultured Croceitalea sp.]|uniref:AMP-binding protein n=1 Tax=uncultured Croceitalea sp. TaxID=1798908 RepID=UPI00330636D1
MEIHPKFKLNGKGYSTNTLQDFADKLSISGESYELSIGLFLKEWLVSSKTITVQTSGSTGTPKSIILQKKQMVNSAMATGEFFQLKEGDKALLCLSAEFIAGKMMLVRAMVLGLELDCVAPTSEPLKLHAGNYDFCAMVPLQAQQSLKELHRIQKLIIGGAQVSYNLRQKLRELNIQCFETYGMTETITHVAVRQIETTFFETLPNVKISTDERGCLVIDAPSISDEKVLTNDLVNVLDASKFVWLGRYDTVINSGGIKLIPEQIEAKLAKVIPQRFFVAAMPDDTLGQKLVLVIESDTVGEHLMTEILFIPELSRYEIPKEIFDIQQFQETKSGKVDRLKTLLKLI